MGKKRVFGGADITVERIDTPTFRIKKQGADAGSTSMRCMCEFDTHEEAEKHARGLRIAMMIEICYGFYAKDDPERDREGIDACTLARGLVSKHNAKYLKRMAEELMGIFENVRTK